MKYGGAEYTTTLHVQFRCVIADHHHLWSECRHKGCLACPWVNKHGAATLFPHKGGRRNDVRGSHKFQGVHELLKIIAPVARRYHPGSLPPDRREHQRLVRRRFQAGIILTSREPRTVMGKLAGGMVLLLPFHSLVMAFCHIVHLCYVGTALANAAWQAMRLVYTYIVHIIPEFAEEGCTATLYMHGWSHTSFNPRTLIPYSHEAGERDLRVAQRYAPVISTRQDGRISESLKHELYEDFLRKKTKIPTAKILTLVHRNLVLEACLFAAIALWQTVFQRLLRHLMICEEAGGRKLYMHPATNSVKCTFPSVELESDVVCVCGTCGPKCGIRQWVTLEVEGVQSWPIMGLKPRSKFTSCTTWRKYLKGKGKGTGKSHVGTIHRPVDSNPSSVLVVLASEAEDSAA